MATAARIRVYVSPRADASEVVGRHGDGWKIRVAAPPEGGRANEEALALLAEAAAVPRAGVALLAGRTSRTKLVELTGVDPAEADRRLRLRSRRRDDD